MIGCRLQKEVAGGKQHETHAEKAGDDALRAVMVKFPDAELAFGQPSHDDAGHEIAGDSKKNVDSDKSARNEINLVMKENDRGDRDRPHGVNVVTELHRPLVQLVLGPVAGLRLKLQCETWHLCYPPPRR